MNQYDYEDTANEATDYSQFGGQRLQQVMTVASNESAPIYIQNLALLGIEDLEQLVAVAAIPGVRDELQSVLSMNNDQLQQLLIGIQSSLPQERIALLSTPAPKEFGLGVLPPTPEMISAAEASSATQAEEAEEIGLPASINLIPYMTPIRNQRGRGTCVSFALTALSEYILRRRNINQDLSEQHLYYETKLIDGAASACGTWQTKAVNALGNRGECREIVWPYNPNPPCNNHGTLPAQARADGLKYRLATIAVSARSVAGYKSHMSKQRPVTLSIPVYNSWYQSQETKRSGRITMRIGNEPAVGGHAVMLVGYEDSPNIPGGGWFIVRNSWGQTWASQSPYGAGYGTIPYQYITNDAMEAFTASVPNIGFNAEGEIGEALNGKSTVTIKVGSDVNITITTG